MVARGCVLGGSAVELVLSDDISSTGLIKLKPSSYKFLLLCGDDGAGQAERIRTEPGFQNELASWICPRRPLDIVQPKQCEKRGKAGCPSGVFFF